MDTIAAIVVWVEETGWKIGAAILLFAIIAIGAASTDPEEVVPRNPFPEHFVETSYTDHNARNYGAIDDKNGVRYSNSLGFNYGFEGAYEKYELGGNYTILSGVVFVPATRESTEGAPIYIYGDNRLLWVSYVTYWDTPAQPFSIDVTGVNTLEFRYNGGNCINHLEIALGNLALI